MPDDEPSETTTETPTTPSPTPRRRRRSAPAEAKAETSAPAPEPKAKKDDDTPKAPRRATLAPELQLLLSARRYLDDKRPRFVRQAAHRYDRIGRDEAWRRPRGQQSKQRRHYGYRSKIVRVGYRSPAAVRGLTPSGFRPVIVRTRDDLEGLDVHRDAAVIARTVGTRRRLVLEEEARRLGIHVLNPIVRESEA